MVVGALTPDWYAARKCLDQDVLGHMALYDMLALRPLMPAVGCDTY
jgi:hypothetical protein